ncbi:MAG: DUF4625 domain-containing protein [Prolixibacteraceae bacterium]|nr:DUF4625 domain-containing protein [Prolixibacteraceae bacterium]MBN2775637.1 DUF4625 domain-containing protein [Prolixibacteraceae bacterium]
MNKKIILIAIILGAVTFFTACNEDDPIAKPEVTILELGQGDSHGNDHIAIVGGDVHIEAEIIAEGKINIVQVRIHPEGEHEEESDHEHEEWEIDTTYTKFSGLIDPVFHEHIDIDISAEPGDYHFDIVVTDMLGYQSSAEAELEIILPNDAVAPEINVLSAPSNNQTFNNGESISISGTVSDDKALGGMYIGLVREDQNLSDAEIDATNTITILHTHDFDSYTLHNFSSSITVGAAQDNNITPKDITGDIAWQSGNYYILVKCKDAFGGNRTFSEHYPITINY